jgi:hypothetical protein
MALLFTSKCAFADFFVLIDSDNNATTGCTFALPTAGTVTGVEHRLTATVSNTVPAQVTQVTLESCAGAAFAAPVTLPGTPYPVGLNIGEAGSDVIELAVARNFIPSFAPLWRLYFAGADPAGDDLLGLSGMAITFDVPGEPAAIPMLTTWGLFGLIALVFLATLRMRARFPSGIANVLLVGVFVSFVAWAAGFVADGQINDWQGVAPAGTDTMGDSLPATDIVAGFAAIEGPNLFFRIDVANSSNSAPVLDLNGPAAGIDFQAAFVEGSSVAVVDDIELIVSDADNINLASATATLTNLLDAGQETLAVSAATLNPTTPIASSYDPATGVLTLTGAATVAQYQDALRTLTYDNGSANPDVTNRAIHIVVNDGALDSPTAVSTVSITSVNDAPSFTKGADQTVNEDSGAQSVAGWATAISDGDGGTQILGFNITGNTNPDLFAAAPSVSSNGVLTYTPAANQNGTATLTLTLSDDGGTANGGVDTSAAQTFVINVSAVNDQPLLDLNGPAAGIDFPAAFIEGGGSVAIVDAIELIVSDIDNINLAAATATLTNLLDAGQETLAVSAATLSPTTPITSSYDPATGVLTLTGTATVAQYQDALRTLIYDNGSASPDVTNRAIHIVVNDGALDSPTAVSTVTITSVNDAPSFTKGADQTVNEDSGAQSVAGWATAISDGDGGTQLLSFNVSNSNNALFSAQPALSSTGTLTYTPAANQNGTATVTLVLSDNGGTANGGVDTSAAQTFVITVLAVTDAPSFTKGADQTVFENSGAQSVSGWATAISPGPADEASQTVNFNVSNTNNALFSAQPALSSTGALTYTPSGTSGSATVSVTLSDNGGTANGGVDTSVVQTFVITVLAVNDAPSFTKGADQSVNEDAGAQSVAGWATAISDGDGGTQLMSFNVSNSNNALFSAQPALSSTGTLTYTPAANQNGTATVSLTLSDNGGTANGGVDTSAAQTFVITVNPVNDAPVAPARSGGDVQANMKRVGISLGLLAGVTDADSGVNGCSPIFTLASIASGSYGTVSNVNLAAGTFDFAPAPGFTGAATATYTVSDDGCPGTATSAPATISFNVLGPVIWFVNPAAAINGDGTLANPFNSLASANAAKGSFAGHRIFVYSGTTEAITGVSLASSQWLVGQGATGASFDSLMGIAPPSDTLSRPGINGTRPTLQGTLTLDGNSVLARGFNLSTGPNAGINDAVGAISGVAVSEVSVTSTTGTAVNLSNLDGTVSLTSVSANGAVSGIVLNGVNIISGSFAVTGTGSAGSGGTIQNSSGDAISLTSSKNISLSRMSLSNNKGNGILGSTVGGFTLADSTVASSGDAPGESGLNFTGLTWIANITNCTVNNSFGDNARIVNTSGVLSQLTVSGSTFRDSLSGNGMLLQADGTASLTADITGSSFLRNYSNGVQVATNGTGTGNVEIGAVVGGGNTFTDNYIGANVAHNAVNTTLVFGVRNNQFSATTPDKASPLNLNLGAMSTSGTLMSGTVANNIIRNANSILGPGIRVISNGAGTLTARLEGNDVAKVLHYGIEVLARDGGSRINSTLANNTVNLDANGMAEDAIRISDGATSTDTSSVCADLAGNTAISPSFNGIEVKQRFSVPGTHFFLKGYPGAALDTTAVQTYLAGSNNGANVYATRNGTGFEFIAACPQP